MKRYLFLAIVLFSLHNTGIGQLHEHGNGNVSIGTELTEGGKLQVADGAADPIKYGTLQIVRPSNADNKFHLSFIRNGLSVSGMGYQSNSNILGIWHGNSNIGTPQLSFSPEQRVGIQTALHQNRFNIGGADGNLHMGDLAFGNGYNGIWLNGSTNALDFNFLSKASDYNLYINRPTGGHIHFRQANQDQMVLTPAGSLGLGTDAPKGRLQLGDRFVFEDGGWKGILYNMAWSPSLNTNARVVAAPVAGMYFTDLGNITFINGPNGSAGSVANAVHSMILHNSGQVGIGTNYTLSSFPDQSFKLFVEGGVRARKVKVDINSWADFVFEPSYNLLNLQEVEQFIKQYRHLPGVPSAREVETEGLDLGASQAVLLLKIEELTLYLIAQQKEIEALKEENVILKNQNEKVEEIQQQVKELQKIISNK